MNRIYKVIYCKATNTFVAVSEFAKGQSKNTVRGAASQLAARSFSGQFKILTLAILLGISGQSWAACSTPLNGMVRCGNGATAIANSVAIGMSAYAKNAQNLAVG